MAEVHGSNTRIYARGVDMTALFTDAECGDERTLVDTTTFSATADSHIASPIRSGELTANGLLDCDPATGAHTTFQALEAATASTSASTVIVQMMRDTTLGDHGFAMAGSVPKLSLKSVLSDVVKSALNAKSDKLGWVRALMPKGSLAAAGNGAALDHGAATTNGGMSVLQVMALTGTTPVVRIKAQHSTDNSTWVDLATHTDVNAAGVTAGYGEVIEVAGTVNRYLRYSLTVVSGSLTSVTFAHQFARTP